MSRNQMSLPINARGPQLRIPDGESRDLEPELLLLDPENLRLLERVDAELSKVAVKLIGQESIQDKLYKIIVEDSLFDIKSLSASIAHNGFLKHERLIVAKYDGTRYLVLEGNRRLTAVRQLLEKDLSAPAPEKLPDYVRQTLKTLPCFVLVGDAIGDSVELLKKYRRASEIYIGMRHLMGAEKWQPASRYEFQTRLISDEGWTPEDVAERFGRNKNEVLRDFKAQRLYWDFRQFEVKNKVEHSLTYNAFAEAARAPSVMAWLGWSNKKMDIAHKDKEASFFHYLVSRLRARARVSLLEGEEDSPEDSAESIVRHLRDMLKIGDEGIESALLDRDFDSADLQFEEKREGTFAKRVASYTRGLKRVTGDELGQNPKENKAKVLELVDQAKKTLLLLDALLKK
jgi:AraC-like DNA-binding protein